MFHLARALQDTSGEGTDKGKNVAKSCPRRMGSGSCLAVLGYAPGSAIACQGKDEESASLVCRDNPGREGR